MALYRHGAVEYINGSICPSRRQSTHVFDDSFLKGEAGRRATKCSDVPWTSYSHSGLVKRGRSTSR